MHFLTQIQVQCVMHSDMGFLSLQGAFGSYFGGFGDSLGGSWGHVGPFFAIFAHFGGSLDASSAILVLGDAFFGFLSIFGRFGMDFGKILGWFFDGFSYFCQRSRFCKNRCFSKRKLLFSRVRACKNQSKIQPNTMQISYGKIKSKKNSRNGFGTVLAFIWEGVGTLWGIFWSLLGASWPFRGRSQSSFCKALTQNGLQEGFWIDFGSILRRIWVDVGRIWEGLGRIWTNLGMDFGRIGWRIWRSVDEFEKSLGRVSK